MKYSLTDGECGIAAALLPAASDNAEVRCYCDQVAGQCAAFIHDPQTFADFKDRSADPYALDQGISGMGIYMSLYNERFPLPTTELALQNIASDLRQNLSESADGKRELSIADWKYVAAFFAVYGRQHPDYANDARRILHAIDHQHKFQFTNLRWGVAGLLVLATFLHDRPLIRKYRQLLLASGSYRGNTMVWPLPGQVYLTNDYFLDGTSGIYWALMYSLNVSDEILQ